MQNVDHYKFFFRLIFLSSLLFVKVSFVTILDGKLKFSFISPSDMPFTRKACLLRYTNKSKVELVNVCHFLGGMDYV